MSPIRLPANARVPPTNPAMSKHHDPAGARPLTCISSGCQYTCGYRLYPWCATRGDGGSMNRYFSTLEQCRAAVSGAQYCSLNYWYTAYGPYYSFGGWKPPRRVGLSR